MTRITRVQFKTLDLCNKRGDLKLLKTLDLCSKRGDLKLLKTFDCSPILLTLKRTIECC